MSSPTTLKEPEESIEAIQEIGDVPRIACEEASADFQQKIQAVGKPVIVTGLFDDTPDWDIDYLQSQLGDGVYNVRDCSGEQHVPDKREWTHIGRGSEMRRMKFSDYAEAIRSGEAAQNDLYLAQNKLRDTPLIDTPALATMAGRFGLDPEDRTFNVWFGPGGHREPLHYDPHDGTLMQLHGAKKLTLFPSEQLKNLYPFPLSRHLKYGLNIRSWFSMVDPELPDYEAFPRYRRAEEEKAVVVLKPGELIFIPSGWWHEVTALGDEYVTSVNHFWKVAPSRRFWSNPGVQRILKAIPFVLIYALLSLPRRDRKQRFDELARQM